MLQGKDIENFFFLKKLKNKNQKKPKNASLVFVRVPIQERGVRDNDHAGRTSLAVSSALFDTTGTVPVT